MVWVYAIALIAGLLMLLAWIVGTALGAWVRASLWLFQNPEAAAVADAERAGQKAADAVVPAGAGKVRTLP